MSRLRSIFPKTSSIPRWVVLIIDMFICGFSYSIATLLRFNFHFNYQIVLAVLYTLPIILVTRLVFMLYFRIYAGIIRHTSLQDALRVFYTITFSSVTIGVMNFIYSNLNSEKIFIIPSIPLGIVIIDYILCIFLMSAFRFTIKVLYMQITKPDPINLTHFAIFGAGEAGLITKRKLEQQRGTEIKVSAFLDDDPHKKKNHVDGVTIYNGEKDFEYVVSRFNIKELIISTQNISKSRKQEIIEQCLALNVKVRNVPPAERWINGELSFNQIKNVKIEDLMERDTIELDKESVAQQIRGKSILVTGAAGSIGSEIVKQLIACHPQKLILLDRSEEGLYELDSYLSENHKLAYSTFIEIIVGDICDESRMNNLFKTHKPNIIYHAAAYKHVPLMEENPSEAIKTNVGGTRLIANMAVNYHAEKFVMISTDKAVNPTNVMGASKRIAEIYVQSLCNKLHEKGTNKIKFITTRFGNVLGSSGSVIPKFRKQIEDGGPITVTHPEITRYFMTIPEACQLVLEAGNMGKGGEIYIFDMGNSTKIIDLAKKMVQLSGLTLGQDIQIVFSGLRPGEKIEEELLADHENSIPTHHPKIMIGKVRVYDFDFISGQVENLLSILKNQNSFEIVMLMKELVPEYISKNSIYESIDISKYDKSTSKSELKIMK
ncbi:MAG: nucleoside-diphosphate sugar epimerase/dehydratase [Bacteroidota bacterium]